MYYLAAAAGAAGGLVGFLRAFKLGQVRNNFYFRKAAIETVGGATVGFFLFLPWSAGTSDARFLISFVGGIGWAVVVELARKKVTDVVNAAFLGTLPKPNDPPQED
ncbi:MAG: hypothetical protein U0804_10785 [Gemmataceae bacterium]